MSDPTFNQHGLSLAQDTGLVRESYSIAPGVFTRILPLAESHNSRIILINRRDYPEATLYNELALVYNSRYPRDRREPQSIHRSSGQRTIRLLGGSGGERHPSRGCHCAGWLGFWFDIDNSVPRVRLDFPRW